MNLYSKSSKRMCIIACMAACCLSGCDNSNSNSPPAPAPPKASSYRPVKQPVSAQTNPTSIRSTTATMDAHAHSSSGLAGITMSVPKEWKPEAVAPSPMAPKAVYRLPKAGRDEDDGMVRVTHFPGMKGKDEMNIDRWLGQVTKNDGSIVTRDDATITRSENNGIKLTMVDIKGTVRVTMRSSAKPNSRMIAVILDHPQGPHFVVIAGGLETMSRWEESIHSYLQSAAVK